MRRTRLSLARWSAFGKRLVRRCTRGLACSSPNETKADYEHVHGAVAQHMIQLLTGLAEERLSGLGDHPLTSDIIVTTTVA